MKILQVTTDDDRRGAQVFAVQVGDRLKERGQDVRTVGLAKGVIGGLDIDVLGPTRFSGTTLGRLRRLIADADVIVAHGSSTFPASTLTGMGLRTPLVYRQISDPTYWTPTHAKRLRVRAYYRVPRHVVALSPVTKQILVERFGLAPDRISVIPNAVDERRCPPADQHARAHARRCLAIADDRLVVGYVGALVHEKGVADLIDALPDNTLLLVAGDGPTRASLELRSVNRGVDICFVGRIDNPYNVYAASDVVALPSRGGDTQPAALIEAALIGTPCVSTSVGAIGDIIQDGRNGLLVSRGDIPQLKRAITTLLQSPALRTRLSHQGQRDAAARYSLDAVARQWERVLEQATR